MIGQVFFLPTSIIKHREQDYLSNTPSPPPNMKRKTALLDSQDSKTYLFLITCFWQALHKYQSNSAETEEIFHLHS